MAEEGSDLQVSVVALSGREVASLRAPSGQTAQEVKRHLHEQLGYPLEAQQLLCAHLRLESDTALAALPQPLLLTLVLLPFDQQAALCQTACAGHTPAVRSLLLQGSGKYAVADRNAMFVALQGAAFYGHEGTVRSLLDFADTAERRAMLQMQKWTVFCAAGERKTLVEGTALHAAVRGGHVAVVRLLLSSGISREEHLSLKDVNNGQTALHVAADYGHESVLASLLELSCKQEWSNMLRVQDKGGEAPLHCAARMGHDALIQLLPQLHLVDKDLKDILNIENQDGETASLVAFRGYKRRARCLAALTPSGR